jgi:hypothetical protein
MTLLALFTFAFLASAASQEIRRHDKLKEIAFVPAKQTCENWALGAVLQSVLEMQQVAIPQATWVSKFGGTAVCSPFLKSPAMIASTVQGDYRLSDNQTVHIQAKAEDTFVDPGMLIQAIDHNRPFILVWKKHTFMAVGVGYFLEIDPSSGVRLYDIQELDLMDPFLGAEQEPAIFRKSAASLKEIGGIIEVIATN